MKIEKLTHTFSLIHERNLCTFWPSTSLSLSSFAIIKHWLFCQILMSTSYPKCLKYYTMPAVIDNGLLITNCQLSVVSCLIAQQIQQRRAPGGREERGIGQILFGLKKINNPEIPEYAPDYETLMQKPAKTNLKEFKI